MSKTVTLTDKQIQTIVDELGEVNNCDMMYIEDPLNEVDDDELVKIDQEIHERNEIITILTAAIG